jgi:uncharacterized OB-fold protein
MTRAALTGRSGPSIDEDSRPYWEALSRHELALQRCTACGTDRCPPLPACHVCGSTDATWLVADGHGIIYSFVVARQPVGDITSKELPVVFATVEIEGGCRLIARYMGDPDPSIGAGVLADFVEHGDWTELIFRSSESCR